MLAVKVLCTILEVHVMLWIWRLLTFSEGFLVTHKVHLPSMNEEPCSFNGSHFSEFRSHWRWCLTWVRVVW